MSITTIIILSLIGLCLGQWHAIIKLQGEATELRRSKDELRDSMASYNYYLYEELRSTKSENEDLRTYIYRQQKEQQKQDN
uniref:Uncharacterized protein n=1 Tax=Siphoviridae sp. ctfYP22 TaxID=2827584 RepID=A0A8S5LIX8_9CAUD|nr:MAG TPA: hypothetical protein [Siphoviridae sp. ctfYP22]